MGRSQIGKEMGPRVLEGNIETQRGRRLGPQGPRNSKSSLGGKTLVEMDERRKGYMETNMDSEI